MCFTTSNHKDVIANEDNGLSKTVEFSSMLALASRTPSAPGKYYARNCGSQVGEQIIASVKQILRKKVVFLVVPCARLLE